MFSEGLHVLGRAPDQNRMGQYLSAYFDGALEGEVIDSVAAGDNLEQIRQRLESSLSLVIHPLTPFPPQSHSHLTVFPAVTSLKAVC